MFSSPNYHNESYPNSQICTWRFLVQNKTTQKEQILIKFLEFDLQKGKDGDVVRIYSGWDDKAPLLVEFNGDNPPPAEGVASGTPVVYLVFSSDSRGRSRGFRGLFVNQGKYCVCLLVISGSSYYMTQKISPSSVTLVSSHDLPGSSVSSASMTRSSTTQAQVWCIKTRYQRGITVIRSWLKVTNTRMRGTCDFVILSHVPQVVRYAFLFIVLGKIGGCFSNKLTECVS